MLAAAVLYGAYWYVSAHYSFSDTLVFAKKHPQASWAPALDYYVGIVYFQSSEYAKSEEAFNQLVTDYSTSTYTPKGLLHLSMAAEENRDWPVARQSLERFIEEFPNHKEKPFAEQRLDLIKFK
jgi:TolA-binding protein